VDGYGFNNLIEVIMARLMKGGELIREDVAKNYVLVQMGLLFFRGVKQ